MLYIVKCAKDYVKILLELLFLGGGGTCQLVLLILLVNNVKKGEKS